MIFVAQTSSGETISYTDRKRYLWVFSVLAPAIPGICSLLMVFNGNNLWAAGALVFYFLIIPLLDMAIGEDFSNPPEEVVEQLSGDNYYRLLLHMTVPIFYFSFLVTAYAIGTLDLHWRHVLRLLLLN